MQFWSIILAAASFAFKIEVKRTHSAVEKRSKVISLPAVFPDLTLRKGDKVLFSAETEEAFEQLILALSDNDHGSSYSYHLKKAVSLDQSSLPSGVYDCKIFAVKGEEKKSFEIGKIEVVGESFVDEKPELFHTFRPEQDLGNLPLAFVFSALTLSPIFVLGKLWTILDVKLKLKKFELWPWLFMLSLGVSLSTFHLFWLKLNLFEFFGVAVPTLLLTIVCGKKALTLHASKI